MFRGFRFEHPFSCLCGIVSMKSDEIEGFIEKPKSPRRRKKETGSIRAGVK